VKSIFYFFCSIVILIVSVGSQGQGNYPELLSHHALSVNWSQDGNLYTTTYVDGNVRIYDSNGLYREISSAHSDSSWDASFNPDASRLATVGDDEAVRIWNTSNGLMVGELVNVGDQIDVLNWSPDGSTIWAHSFPGNVFIISADVLTDAYTLISQYKPGGSFDSQWDSTGNRIAVGLKGTDIRLLDTTSLPFAEIRSLDGTPVVDLIDPPNEQTTSVQWHPTSSHVVANGKINGVIYVWDLNNPDDNLPLLTLEANSNTSPSGEVPFNYAVRDIVFDDTGSLITSVSADGTLRTWDIQSGTLISDTNLNLSTNILSAAFSPDGTKLVYNTYPPALTLPARLLGPESNLMANPVITDIDASGSENVSLDGSTSTDNDGTIVNYSWRENGIEIATGATPTINLATGTHEITLVVIDDDGLTSSDTISIKVNRPPTAAGTASHSIGRFSLPPGIDPHPGGDQEISIVLDASASVDPDGSIVEYNWGTFAGDDSLYSGTQTNTFATITVSGCGAPAVYLTVIDNDGATDTIAVTVSDYFGSC